jgi:secreted trypsin-like serine protease
LFVDGQQVGVVAWSAGDCGEKPGVYTEVAWYADWINAIITYL